MELGNIPGLLRLLFLRQGEQSEQPVYDWVKTVLKRPLFREDPFAYELREDGRIALEPSVISLGCDDL